MTGSDAGGAAGPARRWDLAVFAAVLLGPALFAGAGLALRQRTGDLEERLVRDAAETLDAPHPRSVHVARPTPGTLGDALQAHLPAIEKGQKKGAELESIRAVVAGDQPISSLSSPLAAALDRLGPDLDALLAGTHAERADLPVTPDAFSLAEGATWTGYQFAALLAGLRVRRQLAAGDPAAAAMTCLDGLALGRDAAVAGGLVGRMVQVAMARRLAPPCAAALAALPPAAGRELLEPLRTLREALPSFSTTLREETVATDLMGHGNSLPASARSRLGPRARALASQGDSHLSWPQRLLLRDAWRGSRRHEDELVRAAALDPGAREPAMERLSIELTRRLNPLVAIGAPSYVRYARRAEAGSLLLDALVLTGAAAIWRAESGDWPEDADTLAGAGLLTDGEAERMVDVGLEPDGGGRTLRITLPLPQGDPKKDPDQITLMVDASGRAR